MRLVLNLVLAVLIGLGVQAQSATNPDAEEANHPETSAECIEDREAYFSLDYWTFDQDVERGYRSVALTRGCELAAADLVRDYHALLREKGQPVTYVYDQREITLSTTGEVSILYWHEGQIRAFEGQTQRAIDLFKLSLKPEENNHRNWNEYALASIAFLQNDFPELLRQRTKMASGERPFDINLGVVDGLIACFGATYREAYGSDQCNRRPGWDAPEPE